MTTLERAATSTPGSRPTVVQGSRAHDSRAARGAPRPGSQRRVHVRPAGRPRRGRRLYVATGNVLTNRLAVWDLGAHRVFRPARRPASRPQDPLASCSAPGSSPRWRFVVEVNGAIHRTTCRRRQHSPGLRSHARRHSTWFDDLGTFRGEGLSRPVAKRPRIYGLIGGAVSNSLYALFRSDLVKLYALCAVTQSKFRLMALPLDFPVTPSRIRLRPGRTRPPIRHRVPDGRGRPGPLAENPSRHTAARGHPAAHRG